jgi:hypothetical protein
MKAQGHFACQIANPITNTKQRHCLTTKIKVVQDPSPWQTLQSIQTLACKEGITILLDPHFSK